MLCYSRRGGGAQDLVRTTESHLSDAQRGEIARSGIKPDEDDEEEQEEDAPEIEPLDTRVSWSLQRGPPLPPPKSNLEKPTLVSKKRW